MPINPVLDQLAEAACDCRPVVVAEYASLLDQLRLVPDPRDRRGIRHALASILAVAAAAVLAGARSFTAIGEWIADAPVQVQAALEVRRDPMIGAHRPPHEATIRRLLEVVDADLFDAILNTWLTGRLRTQAENAPKTSSTTSATSPTAKTTPKPAPATHPAT
ncbi:transposase family protein [Nonomuraea sp. LPB2021202275-12-8]|uniref:transposase family protein n=1 Tax=Nonomuraea sp. LPB2021202275-12-8 TaxID=3120159 RepID=UPI00300D519D